MGEVVGLREDSVFAHGEPDEDLAQQLDALAADTRSGSLRAIAWVAVTNERAINTCWSGHCDQHDMIAGLNILNFRLLSQAGVDNG